jgi:ATP-binding cassette subfamily B protein
MHARDRTPRAAIRRTSRPNRYTHPGLRILPRPRIHPATEHHMYFDLRLWAMTAGLRGRVALGVALGMLALAAGIARFAFLGHLLALVFSGAPFERLLPPAAGVAFAVLLRAVLEQVRVLLAHRTAAVVQSALRARLYDKIVALGPGWFAGERTGGVMLSMVDGVEQLQSFFGQYLPQLLVSACAPFVIFAFMAWWDLPVATVMLVAALFALALPGLAHRQNRLAAIARQKAFKEFGEEFLDAMQGLPTLKAFGQSRAYGRMLAGKARALSENTLWVLGASLVSRGITDLGIAVGAAAALALGAWRVTQGEMSLEALLVILMAGTEIFRPLRDLRTVLHQGMSGQSAAQGVHALLEAPETAPTGGRELARDAVAVPGIEFRQVHFAYPGLRAPALGGLDFVVAPGERVGVVGPSGAGKSSIVRLLLRLYDPQQGAVSIGGQDLRAIEPASARRLVAVVAQDTYLFHGTVEENLRLGRPDARDEAVVAAARAANAHDFILALPQGYRTVVGERGTRLSGGQRQRLAIARALLLDAPILILDEALSSVDAENEAVIQQALDRLMQGRTTLILAHRLSSVIGADRILVLDRGRVVQSGRHAELIATEGPYRRLMGAQATEGAASPPGGGDGGPGRQAASQDRPQGHPADTGHAVRDLDADAAAIGWRATLRSLAAYIRPWRGQLALTTVCGIGRFAAFVGVGVIGALILADVKTQAMPLALVVSLLVVAPLAGLLHWLESWLAHDMAYRLLAQMRIRLFAVLDALAPAYLLERRSGDLVALATQDVETVEYFYGHTVAPAVVALLVPCVVLVWLATAAWPIALVLAPFLAFAGGAPILRRARVDRLGSAARSALGQVGAHVTETIQGLAELSAFGAIGRRRAEFIALVGRYQGLRLQLQADLTRQSEQLEIVTGLGGLAVALVGANLVAAGNLAPGMLPLVILVSAAAFLPVSEIAQVSRQLADTIASTRRLHVVEAEPVAIVDGADLPATAHGGVAVEFDHVHYAYPGRQVPALRDVSFTVPAGSTVALVGSSGAGKSTIAQLLLRFRDPGQGVVRLAGRDVRTLSLDGLRGCVALVAQDTYLFNDTLEANILLARPDASRPDLLRAIEQAALSEFVAGLPEGLATRVGERGVQLSGGQRQRVAIARAFLKDAPVLVLDEATSHLDAISEEQVRTALAALMTHRTTLLIAHRLSTIRAADSIVVLDRGRVVEQGTHDALLGQAGLYAHLVGRQVGAVRARV